MMRKLTYCFVVAVMASGPLYASAICDEWAGKGTLKIVPKKVFEYYPKGSRRPVRSKFNKSGYNITITGKSESRRGDPTACYATISDPVGKTQQVTVLINRFTTPSFKEPVQEIVETLNTLNDKDPITNSTGFLQSPTAKAPCQPLPTLPIPTPRPADLVPEEPEEEVAENDMFKDVEELPVPRPRPEREVSSTDLSDDSGVIEGYSPYEIYQMNRSNLRKRGKGGCLVGKEEIADRLLEKSSWSNISESEMPGHIYQEAKAIYSDLQSKGVKLRSYVSPEIVACIAMYENRGHLNPFRINYEYCNRTMNSSAIGLGQITRNTLGDAFDQGEFPIVTDEAKKVLKNKRDTRQRHKAVSSSPRLQLEAVFHVVNLKTRYATRNGRRQASLANVITRYDQDGKSAYVSKVSRCIGDIKSKPVDQVYRDLLPP